MTIGFATEKPQIAQMKNTDHTYAAAGGHI
jgi:hypothetical protein